VSAPPARAAGLERLLRRGADWVDLQWSQLERVLRALAPRARGRLLDVGCGDKPYEAWFRPYVRSYFGIEHATTFGATAAGGRGGPDVVYGGGRLPFRDGAFDTVLSVQVLEHTPAPEALIAEMTRVMAPDGILSAPFQFKLHEEPHDYFRYSPHGLRALCEAAGLEVLETLPQGSLWTVLGQKLNSYLAFHVARVGQAAQMLGKLGHEAPQREGTRWWTLPLVGPGIVSIAVGARVMDRLFDDPAESLGFTILAQRRRANGAPPRG
jgi:SAM-dependent methyltransferase